MERFDAVGIVWEQRACRASGSGSQHSGSRGAKRLAEKFGFCPQGTGKSTKDLVLFVVFYVRNQLV